MGLKPGPPGERSNSKVSGFPMVLVHAHSLLEQKQLWLAQTSFQLDYGVWQMKYMFLATHSLLRLVRSGCLSWDGVMRAAPDDRLALLNAFRTLKKGVKPTEGFQWVVIAMQRLLSKFLKASRLAKNICTNLETPLWWPMVSLLGRPSLSKGQQWSTNTMQSN